MPSKKDKSRRPDPQKLNVEATQDTHERPIRAKREEMQRAHELADQLVRELGNFHNGDLVGEVIATSLKLLRDETNRGDVKLIDKSFRELRHALKVFAPYRGTRKVSIFGSARTEPSHPDYQAASAYGRMMAEAGWMVITGAGGGIMEGRPRRGRRGRELRPEHQPPVRAVGQRGDRRQRPARHVQVLLHPQADVHAVQPRDRAVPGGFGTMDEGFEALTLIQTGKSVPMPIVLVDHPGGDYWRAWDDYVRGHLLANGLISPDDLHLYSITQDLDAAVAECRRFYRNYDSLRFVRDRLVLRLRERPTERQLGEIEETFGDICPAGDWRVSGPLKAERNEPDLRDLTRLRFTFDRRQHGRLRQLIDHLNGLPA